MSIYNYEETAVVLPSTISTAARSSYQEAIIDVLISRRRLIDATLSHLITGSEVLMEVAKLLIDTLRSGHKVLVVGNGRSAAQAQQFASELVGRLKRGWVPYPVLALTSDTSLITSIADNYGYQDVFVRQVQAMGQPGDMFIAFSTSEEAKNVMLAAEIARHNLMSVVAFTGERFSSLERTSDITVRVPVNNTEVVQELHMVLAHILCGVVETHLAACTSEDEWP